MKKLIKKILHFFFQPILALVLRYSWLKKGCMAIATKVGVHHLLRQFYGNRVSLGIKAPTIEELSPYARKIYDQLEMSIRENEREKNANSY